jgi:uncharacterized membrane protein AbrB (regulator of aidB expression)
MTQNLKTLALGLLMVGLSGIVCQILSNISGSNILYQGNNWLWIISIIIAMIVVDSSVIYYFWRRK